MLEDLPAFLTVEEAASVLRIGRTAQVDAAAARLMGEKQTILGRSLTDDERAAVYQLAAYQSRSAKGDGGESTGELRARWACESAAAGGLVDRWLAGRVRRTRRQPDAKPDGPSGGLSARRVDPGRDRRAARDQALDVGASAGWSRPSQLLSRPPSSMGPR